MTHDPTRDCEHGRLKGKCDVCDLQAEVREQCRIIAMGAEREDALRAELTRLKASIALDWMAKNARELGLDYEPAVQEPSLLVTLKAVQGTLIAANEQGQIADTIWFSKYETLFDFIGAEIDKAEQAPPPAAPVQGLPFGVGGGLVAIKTLLGRDPCVHANTAIEMIDAILKEHPAAQPAVQEGRDWSLLAATQESLREHMAEIKRLKAAQPAPVQEPVAWGIIASNTGRICQVELDVDEVEGHNPKHIVPLYTAPQPVPVKTYHDGKPWPVAPKPWVGLTDEEAQWIYDNGRTPSGMMEMVEAKLKEKNT